MIDIDMFQSPSGVLGVCRTCAETTATKSRMFQSPSGVLGVCREQAGQPCKLHDEVSVPFRGFRGLQDVETMMDVAEFTVTFQSPSGVLGVCRRGNDTDVPYAGHVWFQSPCGVLGVCRRR